MATDSKVTLMWPSPMSPRGGVKVRVEGYRIYKKIQGQKGWNKVAKV